jgi:cysteine synthase
MIKAKTVVDFIGNTPLIKIRPRFTMTKANIFVKLEEFNPGGSIKSRIAIGMVKAAENVGILVPNSGQTILEATGGNTGIGLAIMGALRGYKVLLVIPDNFSKEKINILKAYGAEVILSDSSEGPGSHFRRANEILAENENYVMLNQFKNIANPNTHYVSTAEEIFQKVPIVDCFVAGIGSGGTISGVGKKLKELVPNVAVIGVQPENCNVLCGKAIPHKIQALSLGFLPDTLDVNIVDEMISVHYEEVVACLQRLAKTEGLLLGLSSGANICAAIKIAEQFNDFQNIVTVAPDSGRSYMEVFTC